MIYETPLTRVSRSDSTESRIYDVPGVATPIMDYAISTAHEAFYDSHPHSSVFHLRLNFILIHGLVPVTPPHSFHHVVPATGHDCRSCLLHYGSRPYGRLASIRLWFRSALRTGHTSCQQTVRRLGRFKNSSPYMYDSYQWLTILCVLVVPRQCQRQSYRSHVSGPGERSYRRTCLSQSS
jgi:hypothetical protein